MLRTLKIVAHVIWAVSAIGLATTIGAAFGWQRHGWIGAMALGFVGMVAGALVAASPAASLQLLRMFD